MAQVTLKSISKVFPGNVTAVDNVTLEIADKEFMVIVGPSGCGKTTILRMIAGLEEITQGDITIGETIVNDIPPKDRDIAMVFQNYALYPHMTVYQNMAFGLKLRKVPKAEIKQRVEKTAKVLGIEELVHRRPKALSGGQRQRVALGRAIVRNPAAFLFDEPLSNLDAKLRVSTRAELKSLHYRLQTTSIYVTHDQVEAMTLGDRICVMHEGKIQQVDPPMDVYDKPINRFVAGFMGTPSMNFFDGKIELVDSKVTFVLDDGTSISLAHLTETLSSHAGKTMVLGIRPEHLALHPFGEQKNNTIGAKVNVIDPMGNRKDVFVTDKSDQAFVANLDPHVSVNVGDNVTMHINIDQTHVFEAGPTGRNLTV